MITRFSVESFKSLEKVEVELGSVNVFVGANGSGKSNLLEAIGVLGAAAFGRVDDESLLRRGVRPGVGTKRARLRSRVPLSERSSYIRHLNVGPSNFMPTQ
jgi:predicted ATPase